MHFLKQIYLLYIRNVCTSYIEKYNYIKPSTKYNEMLRTHK